MRDLIASERKYLLWAGAGEEVGAADFFPEGEEAAAGGGVEVAVPGALDLVDGKIGGKTAAEKIVERADLGRDGDELCDVVLAAPVIELGGVVQCCDRLGEVGGEARAGISECGIEPSVAGGGCVWWAMVEQ